MEKRIYEAAVEGSVISMLNLLREDPLVLDRVTVNSYGETPLHIACMLGHAEFVQEILKRKPELAKELDSQKSSPLHLATAKGYVNIVTNLVSVNPDMCFALDRDGRNPLHIAAMKGHVDVLREMVHVKPDAARIRMDREETILHVCVRYYQLEAMKYLVKKMKDHEFVNSIDVDGNTILHLAVADKQVEAVKFLTSGTAAELMQVNALNANGFTALDILTQSKRDMKDWEIGESLRRAGAINSAKDIDLPVDRRANRKTRTSTISQNRDGNWLEKMREAIMVVASLIATMAFQAGVNPPGSVWQENLLGSTDPNLDHLAGASIWADQNRESYRVFLFFNTTSFVASLSIILLLVSGLPLHRKAFVWIFMIIMWVAITALAVAYLISLGNISYSDRYSSAPLKALFVWLGLLAFLFLGHSVRLVMKFIKYVRGKRQSKRLSLVGNNSSLA